MDDDEFGWPGDGGGSDDLADYNQNESDDYQNEGQDQGDESDWQEDSTIDTDCLVDE